MKYRVINPLIYGGLTYESGQEIDIFESDVAENCLKREMIEKIGETVKTDVSGETGNKDNVAEDVVSFEDKEDKEGQAKVDKSGRPGKSKNKAE